MIPLLLMRQSVSLQRGRDGGTRHQHIRESQIARQGRLTALCHYARRLAVVDMCQDANVACGLERSTTAWKRRDGWGEQQRSHSRMCAALDCSFASASGAILCAILLPRPPNWLVASGRRTRRALN
jgi:hypothetical protein